MLAWNPPFLLAVHPDDHSDAIADGDATALTIGTSASGGINTVSDVDFFSFQATLGEYYSIRASNLLFPMDSEMTLFDSSETLITTNDDAGGLCGTLSIASSCINWTATGTGTYYLEIKDANAVSGGSYTITLSRDDWPSTFDNSEGNPIGLSVLKKGSGVAISAISQTDPASVTASGHTLVNGQTIAISGVGGMTEVNSDVSKQL